MKSHCDIHNIDFLSDTCPRCAKGDSAPKSVSELVGMKNAEIKAKKDQERERRWQEKGTLAELTEKYISEGDSEDGAYNQAKQELGL